MALGVNSAPSENEYQEHSWGKGGQCVRLTTSSRSSAECYEVGSLNLLKPSGPHRACYGTPLPLPLPAPWSKVLSEKPPTVTHFMEPKASLPWSQQSSSSFYLETNESSRHSCKIPFNIILLCTFVSSKCHLSFRFSYPYLVSIGPGVA
jgi:hypothetical protein